MMNAMEKCCEKVASRKCDLKFKILRGVLSLYFDEAKIQ